MKIYDQTLYVTVPSQERFPLWHFCGTHRYYVDDFKRQELCRMSWRALPIDVFMRFDFEDFSFGISTKIFDGKEFFYG